MIKFAKQQQNVYCNALHHQILQLLSLWYVNFFIDLDTQIKVLPKFIKSSKIAAKKVPKSLKNTGTCTPKNFAQLTDPCEQINGS